MRGWARSSSRPRNLEGRLRRFVRDVTVVRFLLRVLFELLALASIASAGWIAFQVAPGFAAMPYEYEFLFGSLTVIQVIGAVMFHREARRRR